MHSQIRSLKAAWAFLTRVPVGGQPFSQEELRWAPAHFPLVGFGIGSILAAVFFLTRPVGPWGAACLTVAASLLLTGCFHEDGLADTADALGGGFTKERVLEILKDSRIGTFGGAALFVSLTVRVILLSELEAHASIALVTIESISRAPPVIVMARVAYATPTATARSRDIAGSGMPQALVASGWIAVLLAIMSALGALSVAGALGLVAVSVVIATALARYMVRRIGGITGDFLGAIQQIVLIGLWVAWAAAV